MFNMINKGSEKNSSSLSSEKAITTTDQARQSTLDNARPMREKIPNTNAFRKHGF